MFKNIAKGFFWGLFFGIIKLGTCFYSATSMFFSRQLFLGGGELKNDFSPHFFHATSNELNDLGYLHLGQLAWAGF